MAPGADKNTFADIKRLETLFFKSSRELCFRLRRITPDDDTARHILIDAFRRLWKYGGPSDKKASLEIHLQEACIKQAAFFLRTSGGKGAVAKSKKALRLIFREPLEDILTSGPEDSCDTRVLWQELQQAIDEDELRTSKYQATGSIKPKSTYIRLAGIAVLLLCLLYLFYQNYNKNRAITQQMLTAKTEERERTDLLFSDNTRVWLNQKTTLLYPAAFETQPLSFYLVGEAFFEIIERAAPPISIEAGNYSFQSFGGSFSIGIQENNPEVLISVLSGQVKWKEKDSGKFRRTISEGLSLRLGIANENHEIVPFDNDPNDTAWKTGLITFANAEMPAVLKALEKSYMVRFDAKEDIWKAYRFTGIFKDALIEDILTEISLKTPISFILEDDTYQLSVPISPSIIHDYTQVDHSN